MATSAATRHVLRVLCLTVLLVRLPHGAYADAWSQIGPEAGTVNSVAVDPVTTSTVYAATNGGVFKSTDGGAHWLLTGLSEVGVATLAIDPHTPSTLYAGGSDIFKSTDGGGTWSTPEIGRSIFSLAVDPNTPTTIFAVAFDGVFKSTDAGGTWTHNESYPCGGGTVAIDPVTPSTVYASLSLQGDFGPNTVASSKSTDGGTTWTFLGGFGSSALAIDPVNTAVVYAGNSKSTDGGASWSAMPGLGALVPNALAIDPTNTATVYAGTAAGVSKSTDAGASWAATNLTQSVGALAIDPQQTANLYAGTSNGVYGSTDAGGNWTLDNSGVEGLHVARVAVDPQDSTRLYAPSDHGPYISTDGGGNWAATDITADLTSRTKGDLVVAPSNPSTLYALSGSSLSKSTDAGATWSLLSEPTDYGFSAFAVDPRSSTTLYGAAISIRPDGVTAAMVFKSTDGGATWGATVPKPPGAWLTRAWWLLQASVLAVDPTNSTNIYAGTAGRGIMKSTDAGATWAFSNNGLPIVASVWMPGASVQALAIDPTTTSTLYAGLEARGIIKSTDAGASWIPINKGLSGRFFARGVLVTGFAIDPSDSRRVYAGTTDFSLDWPWPGPFPKFGPRLGVIRSTDGGASWTAFNAGLLDQRDPVVSLDPSSPSTLYAGTLGLGAFRRTATCAGDADCDDGNDCTIDACDAGTDSCSHVAAADGAPCSDGFACTTPGTCSSGVCVGQGATDTCANLFPGFRAKDPECMQEWSFLAQQNLSGGVLKGHRLICTDDDPLCDFGPPGDHACTFRLALCFKVTQPSACTPTADVVRVQVVQPSWKTTDPVQIANRKALNDAVIALGGDLQGVCTNRGAGGQFCQQNSNCDTQPGSGDGQCNTSVYFSPTLSATDACTTLANVQVPLRPRTSGGFARGTQRMRIRTSTSASTTVNNTFTLTCQPGR